jgi:hypothetical protein
LFLLEHAEILTQMRSRILQDQGYIVYVAEIGSLKACRRVVNETRHYDRFRFAKSQKIDKLYPSSWIQFTGSLYQDQKNDTEEASLIEVAECLIFVEEFIKSRRMLVTSRLNPTRSTNPSPGEGT